jgi:hypothetical protein
MRTIKLTDKELDHLRSFYEMELAEATRYVEQVKAIIAKLNPVMTTETITTKPSRKKRVQKTRILAEKVTTVKEKIQKSAEPKDITAVPALPLVPKKRGRKPANKELTLPQEPTVVAAPPPVVPPVAIPAAPVVAKLKKKRKGNYKRKGVFLTNWSKPLPRKPEPE